MTDVLVRGGRDTRNALAQRGKKKKMCKDMGRKQPRQPRTLG